MPALAVNKTVPVPHLNVLFAEGAKGCAIKFKIALSEIKSVVQSPFKIQWYWYPLIAAVVLFIFKEAEFAPAMFVKVIPASVLCCHW